MNTSRLHKLRRMSPGELRWRVSGLVRQRSERRRWRRRQAAAAPYRSELPHGCSLLENAAKLVPGASCSEISELARRNPDFHERLATRCIETANEIRQGRCRMLGHNFDLGNRIDWHRDPRSGYSWPETYYGDLPLYDLPDNVDVKYVWELGRQQYVVDLARGWLFSGDGDDASRAREILLDWIARNPLYQGVHWTSGLEVAMRAISWIWTLATTAHWEGWQGEDLRVVSGSLAEHAEYLAAHFSFYSSPYNHLMGEASALYLISSVLHGHALAAQWRGRAGAVLAEHGPRQFYEDGFCVEQATGYHYYTLGFLTLAMCAARTQGEPLATLEPVVQRAYRAGLAFRQPDGRWPAIGDVDSARSIPVRHDDFWRFDSLNAVAAVLFDDEELKTEGSEPGEELYWLLGGRGVEHWSRLDGVPAAGAWHLTDSGYFVACDGADWMVFDAGPIAGGLFSDATPSTAHGHADTLQVLYYSQGHGWLLDPGMPFYGGDPEWVSFFRSPAAHNCVEIEGVERVRAAGRLAWSHELPRPTLRIREEQDAVLVHGSLAWPGVVHDRQVLRIAGEGLWIADLVTTDRPREVRWNWQLPNIATASVECSRDDRCVAELAEFRLCSTTNQHGLQARLVRPSESSPAAWLCPGYGVREAGLRLVVRQVARTRLVMLTAMGRPGRFVQCNGEGFSLGSDPGDGVQTASRQRYAFGSLEWVLGEARTRVAGL